MAYWVEQGMAYHLRVTNQKQVGGGGGGVHGHYSILNFGLFTIQEKSQAYRLSLRPPSQLQPIIFSYNFPCDDFFRAPPLLKIPSNISNFLMRTFETNKPHANVQKFTPKQ